MHECSPLLKVNRAARLLPEAHTEKAWQKTEPLNHVRLCPSSDFTEHQWRGEAAAAEDGRKGEGGMVNKRAGVNQKRMRQDALKPPACQRLGFHR